MFSVTIMALVHAEDDLLAMRRKINHQIEELQDITSSLRRLSGFEEISSALIKQSDKLADEKLQISAMIIALQDAGAAYLEGERRNLTFEDAVSRAI